MPGNQQHTNFDIGDTNKVNQNLIPQDECPVITEKHDNVLVCGAVNLQDKRNVEKL